MAGPADLGRVLRAARKAGGLTLEQAAAGLGIAKQTLQNLERGTGTVGLGIALRVAAELGVTLFTAPSGQKDQIRHAFAASELSADEWNGFAADCGLPPVFVRRELVAMANAVGDAVPRVAADTIAARADPSVVRLIADGVQAECARQIGIAALIRTVSAD